ncbi:MAG: hypothetical protein RLY93_20535 [Sumerlaeia bacterium]
MADYLTDDDIAGFASAMRDLADTLGRFTVRLVKRMPGDAQAIAEAKGRPAPAASAETVHELTGLVARPKAGQAGVAAGGEEMAEVVVSIHKDVLAAASVTIDQDDEIELPEFEPGERWRIVSLRPSAAFRNTTHFHRVGLERGRGGTGLARKAPS